MIRKTYLLKTNKNLIKNNLELHKKLPPSNSFTIIWNTYVIFGHFNSQWYSTCPSSPSYCKLSLTVLYFFFPDKILKIFRIPVHPFWSTCKITLNMEPPSPFYKSLAYRNLSVITQHFISIKLIIQHSSGFCKIESMEMINKAMSKHNKIF